MIRGAVKVDVPKQVVIEQDTLSIPEAVAKAGLTLPVGMCMP